MAISEVKALTFDVFGTVVDWRGSIARGGAEFAAEHGIKGVDWAAFANAWRARYQPSMAEVRSGRRPWANLDTLHRENLEAVLPEFGIDGLDETALGHLNRIWHRLDPWPDVIEGLTRLKRKYILVTLSNGNVALMVNMAKRAGLPWDAVLGAEVSRHYKPEPEAYLITAELLGLAPEQCMMVAAHNNDLVAASQQGLRTAFVPRPTEYGPDQHRDFKAEHNFDVIAEDFVDMAAKLGT